MILAISACPTTIAEILDLADKVEKDEMRIDEVVDGLIDPNAKDDFDPKQAAPTTEDEEAQIEEEEGEEDEEAAEAAQSAEPARSSRARRWRSSRASAACSRRC